MEIGLALLTIPPRIYISETFSLILDGKHNQLFSDKTSEYMFYKYLNVLRYFQLRKEVALRKVSDFSFCGRGSKRI